jgi:hypothetical protein
MVYRNASKESRLARFEVMESTDFRKSFGFLDRIDGLKGMDQGRLQESPKQIKRQSAERQSSGGTQFHWAFLL